MPVTSVCLVGFDIIGFLDKFKFVLIFEIIIFYRDKILTGNRYYSKLSKTILARYPNLGTEKQRQEIQKEFLSAQKAKGSFLQRRSYLSIPTFPQFVQFLIDSEKNGVHLDEHWAPMYRFCSPCLVKYDVIAKVRK